MPEHQLVIATPGRSWGKVRAQIDGLLTAETSCVAVYAPYAACSRMAIDVAAATGMTVANPEDAFRTQRHSEDMWRHLIEMLTQYVVDEDVVLLVVSEAAALGVAARLGCGAQTLAATYRVRLAFDLETKTWREVTQP